MASESSFDIVSKVDKQEVANALHQAQKEVSQRYDFRGVDAEIDFSGEKILIKANAQERALAVLDVFQSKLVKRGISLKSLDAGDPYASGKETRIECSIKEGIAQDQAKKISKLIRDEGPKGVKATIQGDELRVSSKSRDDLQSVISLLKGADLDVDLQFVNYGWLPVLVTTPPFAYKTNTYAGFIADRYRAPSAAGGRCVYPSVGE